MPPTPLPCFAIGFSIITTSFSASNRGSHPKSEPPHQVQDSDHGLLQITPGRAYGRPGVWYIYRFSIPGRHEMGRQKQLCHGEPSSECPPLGNLNLATSLSTTIVARILSNKSESSPFYRRCAIVVNDTAHRRAISIVPHGAEVVPFLLQSPLSHSSTPKIDKQCVLGGALTEASAKDTDDAETKDNGWCMTSYVL
jgi:hypothetical protein